MKIDNVVVNVPLKDIVADDEMNSRQSFVVHDESAPIKAQTLKGLMESIATEGQITPVMVKEIEGGKFYLIAGFRRFTAIKALYNAEVEKHKEGVKGADPAKYQSIRAQVVRGDDRLSIRILNLVENLARKDLSPYEVAEACVKLQEAAKPDKLSGNDIADKIGLSRQYVGNLLTNMSKLNPKIREYWKRNHPVCTTGNLNAWRSLEHDAQWELFVKANGGAEPEDIDVEDDATGKPTSGAEETPKVAKEPTRPSAATLMDAIAAVKAAEGIKPEEKKAMLVALEYAAGERKTLGKFFDAEKAAEERKKVSRRERAEAQLAKLKEREAKLKAEAGL